MEILLALVIGIEKKQGCMVKATLADSLNKLKVHLGLFGFWWFNSNIIKELMSLMSFEYCLIANKHTKIIISEIEGRVSKLRRTKETKLQGLLFGLIDGLLI